MPEELACRRIQQEGLVGTLFHPDVPGPHSAVVVLGGSGGGVEGGGGAAALASEGFAALALAYFGTAPLPEDLVELPLEYFSDAVAWLKKQPEVDPERVAVAGYSKGAELALLLGSTYPEDFRAVVGYAPSAVVWQSPSLSLREMSPPRSSWSVGGKPVPFVPYATPLFSELIGTAGAFAERPTSFRPLYERSLEYDPQQAVAEASIAVEKIKGPVLLVSGTDDEVWPSTRLSEMVVQRLEEHRHPFPYEHLCYEGAGHLLIPGSDASPEMRQRARMGGSREANQRADDDSWPKLLGFLKESLGEKGAGAAG